MHSRLESTPNTNFTRSQSMKHVSQLLACSSEFLLCFINLSQEVDIGPHHIGSKGVTKSWYTSTVHVTPCRGPQIVTSSACCTLDLARVKVLRPAE